MKTCEYKIEKVKTLEKKIEDASALIELLSETDDQALFEELNSTILELVKEVEEARLETLLSGKYDSFDRISGQVSEWYNFFRATPSGVTTLAT